MQYNKVECEGCDKGIEFCRHRPCWGSVKRFEQIIDAGYADRLMLDYWAGGGSDEIGHEVLILSGANNGCEKDHAALSPVGTCSFLVDNKCSIYNIQPEEGGWSCCKSEEAEQHTAWRMSLVRDWDTDAGRALVERWRDMVGLKEERPGPDMAGMMQLLLDTLKQ